MYLFFSPAPIKLVTELLISCLVIVFLMLIYCSVFIVLFVLLFVVFRGKQWSSLRSGPGGKLSLKVLDFGNPTHLSELNEMGISFQFQEGGKVILAHKPETVSGEKKKNSTTASTSNINNFLLTFLPLIHFFSSFSLFAPLPLPHPSLHPLSRPLLLYYRLHLMREP